MLTCENRATGLHYRLSAQQTNTYTHKHVCVCISDADRKEKTVTNVHARKGVLN